MGAETGGGGSAGNPTAFDGIAYEFSELEMPRLIHLNSSVFETY